MKPKPILFNVEMVRAILEDLKTVTRRVVKFPEGQTGRLPSNGDRDYLFYPCGIKRPPYHPGYILYVRETWAPVKRCGDKIEYAYKADNTWSVPRWHPSIHMPREAARIFLRVTEVRAERLQEITEEQVRKEGAKPLVCWNCGGVGCSDCAGSGCAEPALVEFRDIWNSTIKKADRALYGWDANPWVWVIEFERISREDAAHGS